MEPPQRKELVSREEQNKPASPIGISLEDATV